MKSSPLILAILMASWALAQQAPAPNTSPVIRGGWKGTAGPAFMRGRWAGQADAHDRNVARGSWTLRNDSGQTTAEGRWTARKAKTGWHGTWTARTAGGQSYAGSWSADATATGIGSLGGLLQKSLEKEVSGAWRSGRFGGNWWIRADMTDR
jgi:hypothetical protein